MTNFEHLYNPDAGKIHIETNRFFDKKLGFQVIEHGTILPYKKLIDGKTTADYWGFGGIVDKNGEFVKSSFVHYGAGSSYTPPPNQFNTAIKPLFISECFTAHGDM